MTLVTRIIVHAFAPAIAEGNLAAGGGDVAGWLHLHLAGMSRSTTSVCSGGDGRLSIRVRQRSHASRPSLRYVGAAVTTRLRWMERQAGGWRSRSKCWRLEPL